MNISISQLTNGWLVVVTVPNQGNRPTYFATFSEVVKYMDDIDKNSQAQAAAQNNGTRPSLPTDGSVSGN